MKSNFCVQKIVLVFALLSILICAFSCKMDKVGQAIVDDDPHSYSNPKDCKVNHLYLNLILNFDQRVIEGVAEYTLAKSHQDKLILDIMDIDIDSVYIESNKSKEITNFQIGQKDSILGSALTIDLKKETQKVIIKYRTSRDAMALQWLDTVQTGSKKMPFLFTQSQSVFARSWIPCPDGPGIRFTYSADIKAPAGMMVAMSSQNSMQIKDSGNYHFEQTIPIPAYLIALAAGDFKFKFIGNQTGVYAEPHIIDKAAYEFADLQKMLETAESLYGKYPWGRYDVLVLPASFPFGGMENPMLTFATPTVICGDRSMTSLLAHELAHSWSGNLVTNATWNDFWLNEGFTTYFESRIMEAIYGKEYADMLSLLGFQDLKNTIKEHQNDSATCLKAHLVNPEDGMSDIAYEKGKLFLRFCEERFGRTNWDAFLNQYFSSFQFQSMDTEKFRSFLHKNLNPAGSLRDTIDQWLYSPGMPEFVPAYSNSKFKRVEEIITQWQNTKNNSILVDQSWSTHEYLHFIRHLPNNLDQGTIEQLDQLLSLSTRNNSEINFAWYIFSLKNHYVKHVDGKIKEFLLSIGRRRYVLPIYEEMIKTGLRSKALSIFQEAKTMYHPITKRSVAAAFQEKI
ncbi:MAG TPA: M1 family metallopeptidase [Saprospiraceae bacterium]|nr:M1 family metallopeptidase [Saprospiraceae bacterium]